MQKARAIIGAIGALVPILYCAGLAYYFFDVSGSAKQLQTDGLGPTVMGLGTIGLLFCIPLIVKVIRLFAGPRTPGGPGAAEVTPDNGKGGFDADAVVARYLARQSVAAAAPRANRPLAPAKHPNFGRRIR